MREGRRGADAAADRRLESVDAYEAKIRRELDDADSAAGLRIPSWAGDALASVMVVKAVPGPAESSGGPPFSGEDGEALRKALRALGRTGEFLGVYAGIAEDAGGAHDDAAVRERLAIQLAAADPSTLIAADGEAADLLAAVLGVKRPAFGRPVEVRRMTFVAVEDFEGSLRDERRKKRAWAQLKPLRSE